MLLVRGRVIEVVPCALNRHIRQLHESWKHEPRIGNHAGRYVGWHFKGIPGDMALVDAYPGLRASSSEMASTEYCVSRTLVRFNAGSALDSRQRTCIGDLRASAATQAKGLCRSVSDWTHLIQECLRQLGGTEDAAGTWQLGHRQP